MRKHLQLAHDERRTITIPAPVVVEWWRGRSDVREHILASASIELSERLARQAGEALAAIRGATAIDSIVMASAAQRGDIVYTSDVDALERFSEFFPEVRVLRA